MFWGEFFVFFGAQTLFGKFLIGCSNFPSAWSVWGIIWGNSCLVFGGKSNLMQIYKHCNLQVRYVLKVWLPSLKLTANASENGPGPNRKGLSPNHQFSGRAVGFREGRWFLPSGWNSTNWWREFNSIFEFKRCRVLQLQSAWSRWVLYGIFGTYIYWWMQDILQIYKVDSARICLFDYHISWQMR